MIYHILLWLFVYLYWIYESISEAMTWKSSSKSTRPINPNKYHSIRIPEELAIFACHFWIGFLYWQWIGLLFVLLLEITGCILYLRTFYYKVYGKFWCQPERQWLGIKIPSLKFQIVIFIFCIILMSIIVL